MPMIDLIKCLKGWRTNMRRIIGAIISLFLGVSFEKRGSMHNKKLTRSIKPTPNIKQKKASSGSWCCCWRKKNKFLSKEKNKDLKILTVTAFASTYTVGVFLLGHGPCKRRLVALSYPDTPASPSERIVEYVMEPSHWSGVLNDWANFRTEYKLEHLGSKGHLSATLVTKITGCRQEKKILLMIQEKKKRKKHVLLQKQRSQWTARHRSPSATRVCSRTQQ